MKSILESWKVNFGIRWNISSTENVTFDQISDYLLHFTVMVNGSFHTQRNTTRSTLIREAREAHFVEHRVRGTSKHSTVLYRRSIAVFATRTRRGWSLEKFSYLSDGGGEKKRARRKGLFFVFLLADWHVAPLFTVKCMRRRKQTRRTTGKGKGRGKDCLEGRRGRLGYPERGCETGFSSF